MKSTNNLFGNPSYAVKKPVQKNNLYENANVNKKTTNSTTILFSIPII